MGFEMLSINCDTSRVDKPKNINDNFFLTVSMPLIVNPILMIESHNNAKIHLLKFPN